MKNLMFAFRPLALDLISTLVFVALSALTHDPLLATGVAMAAGVGRVIWLKRRGERIAALQWLSLGLVMLAGAATLITQDPRFMMGKATVIYLMVGVAMLERGWMVPYLPPVARGRVPEAVMVRWGFVWAGLMFVTAAANLAFTLWGSFAAWTSFIAIFPLVSKFVLFAIQYLSIRAGVRRGMVQEPVAA